MTTKTTWEHPSKIREGDDHHWYYYPTKERALAALAALRGIDGIGNMNTVYGGESKREGYEGMHYLTVTL